MDKILGYLYVHLLYIYTVCHCDKELNGCIYTLLIVAD